MSHPGRLMAKPTATPFCLALGNDSGDRSKGVAVRLSFGCRVSDDRRSLGRPVCPCPGVYIRGI